MHGQGNKNGGKFRGGSQSRGKPDSGYGKNAQHTENHGQVAKGSGSQGSHGRGNKGGGVLNAIANAFRGKK